MSKFRGTGGRLGGALAIAVAVVVAACTAAVPAAQASTKRAGAGTTTRVVHEAQQQLDKYKGTPKFVAPDAPFKASSLKGKTIALIGINLTTPSLDAAISGAQQAAKAVGIQTTVFDGKNDPSLWNEGIAQAISSHDAAIGLYGVPTGAVTAQLKTAKSDGIPVVNVENNQPNASAPGQGAGPDIYAAAVESYKLEAELAVDAAIVRTKGHAKVIIVNTPTITPSASIVAGFKSALAKCSGCSVVAETTVHIATWVTGLGPDTVSTLRSHPNANVILPEFDTMAVFIVPALIAGGYRGKVTVQTTSGAPSAAGVMLKDPTVLTAMAGQSDYWSGWLSANQMMRGMLHLQPGNPVVPVRYVTPATVKKLGTSEADLYGTAYKKDFKKLWGVG